MSVSVIIPCYNAEKYILDAVRSVKEQTRPAEEIIVVDDAGTDGSAELLSHVYPDVVLVRLKENSGPAEARNAGAAWARGDCLAFLDADDRWLPNHLETMLGLLGRFEHVDLAFSQVRLTGDRQQLWPDKMLCVEHPQDVFFELMRNNFVLLSSVVVRRTLFERLQGLDQIERFYKGRRVQAEDYEFLLRASLSTSFVAPAYPTAEYRIHAGQSSMYNTPQVIMSFIYRVRILNGLEDEGHSAAFIASAVDRMQLSLEEYLEKYWFDRRVLDLRMLVEYGRSEPQLKEQVQPYIIKSKIPRWVWSLHKQLVWGS